MSQKDRVGVVLDIGGQWARAGFAGEPSPRAQCQSLVGRFRDRDLIDGYPEVYCGQEAIIRRGVSRLTCPIKDGFIQDWDDLEKLLHYTFYKELMVAPEETRVMFALHPLTSVRSKERLAELLFETFIVDGIYLALSPALVTLSSGRTTGLVWENGYSSCYAAPVFEGFTLKHSIVTSQLTGEALTKRLLNLMLEIGYSFTTPTEIELAEKIKADICYVASDYDALLASRMSDGDTRVRYELPHSQHVILNQERFKCPEMLFRPSLQGLACPNIVDDIHKSISRCDMDYQATFYENILMSGGSSQFPGLASRLHLELRQPGAVVEAAPARQHAAWRGGAMLASMPSSQECFLTRQEYEDAGAETVQHKFY